MDLNKLKKKLPETIFLKKNEVFIIDQTKLPVALKYLKLKNYKEAIGAIKNMNIRGAEAIGACGAAGIYLAAQNYQGNNILALLKLLNRAQKEIIGARPTAVNLAWAVNQMLFDLKPAMVSGIKTQILARYKKLLAEQVLANIKLGEYGEKLIKNGMRIETHCNAGSLSGIWFGTATAPMFAALIKNKKFKVLVDETRPWLQGSRLTAWELDRAGIDYSINIDSAMGYMMAHGLVDMVIVGADRIAANGDFANKIGTYPLALMAKEHHIPFYMAAVAATIDKNTKTGADIKIEERPGAEIIVDIKYKGRAVAPKYAETLNPVFDVTPAKLVTGIITEKGIFKPQEIKNLSRA